MVAYAGGKAVIGKRIFHDICRIEQLWLSYHSQNELLPYFEPFIGMGGVMVHFARETKSRNLFGCDISPDIIEFWIAVTNHNWHAPPVEECWTRENWDKLKLSNPSALRCFIGAAASYRCIFFASYRPPKVGKFDYYSQAVKKMEKFRQPMKKVNFLNSRSYEEFKDLKGRLIYADPPYLGNKLSPLFRNFDSVKFWEHMRVWSKHNLVLVSEKTAPRDFVKVGEYRSHFGEKMYTEYLFIYEDIARKLGLSTDKQITA